MISEMSPIIVPVRMAEIPYHKLTHTSGRKSGAGFSILKTLLWVVFFTAILAGAKYIGLDGSRLAKLTLALGIGVGVLLLLAIAIHHRACSRIATAPCRAGTTTITFDPGGIEYQGTGIQYRAQWSIVFDIRVAYWHTLIMISPDEFIPVPDKALPAGLPPEDFLARIAEWRRKATP